MVTILEYQNNLSLWDGYVDNHKNATIYHKIGWKRIIETTFNHKSFFLMAHQEGKICGVLPLFFMKSRIFGRYLISLPFIDSAGLLADTQDIATLLCNKAIDLAQNNHVDFMELRNPLQIEHHNLTTATHKVNFILPLTAGPDFLWKKVFHENIRNKVRKALKTNLSVEFGNNDYFINNFYNIFSKNMRYLGTPVYPRKFFLNIAKEFPRNMLVFLAYHEGNVIGGKIVLLFRDTVSFIYHSSLREYAKLAPNNLLYWRAIEYACQNGYTFCNMGRSTKDTGPYNFKKQWGGEARQLYWQYYLNKGEHLPNLSPTNPKFSLAIDLWKRLPLWLTQLVGPIIARHIP
jgi:FemAB-related protein (PEP-CTERM system-associated)